MLTSMFVLSLVFFAFLLLLLFAFITDNEDVGAISVVLMIVIGFVNSVMGIVHFAINC